MIFDDVLEWFEKEFKNPWKQLTIDDIEVQEEVSASESDHQRSPIHPS